MQEIKYVFASIEAANAELATYVPAVREVTGKDITLDRMKPLMEVLGNPERKVKIVHVAGTSGKTSTAYYIAKMLQKPGTNIGLTVSPHLDKVTERIQINSTPIDEWAFCRELGVFLHIIRDVQPRPTYFELLVAFAYWYFAKVGVDIAVIETGFGGLHDGTNVAQSSNKLCVITDIGFDHTAILGDTLPKIAAQKAGIIHALNTVYMYEQADDVMEVFRTRSLQVGATLQVVQQESLAQQFQVQDIGNLPLFQQRNWLLARLVCENIAKKHDWELNQTSLEESLQVQVPGRMEIIQSGNKTIVLDGAHNEQKMQSFVASFEEQFPEQKATVLLSLKKDKEYHKVLPLLRVIADTLIVTSFDAVQDLPVPSMDPGILAEAARKEGFANVQVYPDSKEAYDVFLFKTNGLGVVTGSFYLLGLVRQFRAQRKVRVMAAIDSKQGLADEKGIPWDVPSDRKYLRNKTMGGVLLMGYNTYAEFDSPMSGRRNLVIARDATALRSGFEAVYDVGEFMKTQPDNLWLFGGADAFKQTFKYADELYLTRIEGDFDCTKFFPEFETDFIRIEVSEPQQENGITFQYEIWQRKD